jgi:anti-anti-sigma factor
MAMTESTFSTSISFTDRWVVALGGELDAGSKDSLLSLARSLSAQGDDAVDFDLAGVTFIDNGGWSAVCRAAVTLRVGGAASRIVNPSPVVRRLTDLIGDGRQVSGRYRTPLVPAA